MLSVPGVHSEVETEADMEKMQFLTLYNLLAHRQEEERTRKDSRLCRIRQTEKDKLDIQGKCYR